MESRLLVGEPSEPILLTSVVNRENECSQQLDSDELLMIWCAVNNNDLMFESTADCEKSHTDNSPSMDEFGCENSAVDNSNNVAIGSVIPLFVQQQHLDEQSDDYWMSFLQPTTSQSAPANHRTASSPQLPLAVDLAPPLMSPFDSLQRPKPLTNADQTVPHRTSFSPCLQMPIQSQDSSSPDGSPFSGYIVGAAAIKCERVSAESDWTDVCNSSSNQSSQCLSAGRTIKRTRLGISADEVEDPLTEKKLRRKEQNRRAATKCRNKRRTEFEQLKKNFDAVQSENARLKREVEALKIRYDAAQRELCRHQINCHVSNL